MFVHGGVLFLVLTTALSTYANPITRNQIPHHDGKAPEANKTIQKREEPSAYPWADNDDPLIKNEFKWLGWDVNNKDDERDGRRIHKAFREWIDFAKAGQKVAAMYGQKPPNPIFERWFGQPEEPDDVVLTFNNMIDPDTGDVESYIALMVNVREDFAKDEKERCAAKPTRSAYTIPDNGKFHVCRYGLDKPLNSELKCEDLDPSVSINMRSLPMTFLHETTHYNLIDASPERIIDLAKDASDCFKLSSNDKLLNAQNYAWLAGEAYWSEKCGKTFEDPPPGTKDNEDDGSSSVPVPPSPPPTPQLTKALAIVADVGELNFRKKSDPTMTWQFFATDYGHTIDCRKDPVYGEQRKEDVGKAPLYPGGTFNLNLFGEDCQYKNNGMNEGKLFCGSKEISCNMDPAYKVGMSIWRNIGEGGGGNYMCDGTKRQPMYTCAW